MEEIKQLEKLTFVEETYIVVSEYEVHVKDKAGPIGIKVVQDRNGKYLLKLSHYYQSSQDATPYSPSFQLRDSKQEALEDLQRLESKFNEDGNAGKWHPNKDH